MHFWFALYGYTRLSFGESVEKVIRDQHIQYYTHKILDRIFPAIDTSTHTKETACVLYAVRTM